MLPFKKPEKILHIKEVFQDKIHSPWSLEIQPTNVCNLNCHFCGYRKRKAKKQASLDHVAIDSLIHSIRNMGIRGVYISGGGEPTIWRTQNKHLENYIEEMSKTADVALITNGSFLKDKIINLSKHCFYLLISLYNPILHDNPANSSMSPELFKQVEENIRNIVALKKSEKLNLPFLTIKAVIGQDNYKHIMNLYEHAKNLGADHIVFRPIIHYEGNMDSELNKEQIKWVRDIIDSNKDKIDPAHTDLFELFRPHKHNNDIASKCWIVSRGFYCSVDPAGDVYPCLFFMGKEDYCVGNINTTPLHELWGSEKHKIVINRLNSCIGSKRCKKCRFMQYNRIIEQYMNEQNYEIQHASFI